MPAFAAAVFDGPPATVGPAALQKPVSSGPFFLSWLIRFRHNPITLLQNFIKSQFLKKIVV